MIARHGFARLTFCLLCLAAPALLGLAGCAHAPLTRDRRVLVMNFENALTEPQARDMGRSLADLMTTTLANYPRVAAVERQSLGASIEHAEAQPTAWQALGRKARADYLVIGSVARLNQNYVINARLFAVSSGQLVSGSAVSRYCNRPDDLYPLVQAISRVLATQIKYLAEMHDAQERGAAAPPPALTTPSVPPAGNPL